MRLWIKIVKVCSSCPKSIYLRRGNNINWGIYFVPGVGKEVLCDSECGAPAGRYKNIYVRCRTAFNHNQLVSFATIFLVAATKIYRSLLSAIYYLSNNPPDIAIW